MFRFVVPLTSEHEVTARSGTLSDTIAVRRVDEPNPDYSVAATVVANWFDTVDLPSPDGYYSIDDTMADLKSSAEAKPLVEALMQQAAAGRGDVAQNVELPESVQEMVDRMTVKTLLGYAGPVISPDDVAGLNAALNRIPK